MAVCGSSGRCCVQLASTSSSDHGQGGGGIAQHTGAPIIEAGTHFLSEPAGVKAEDTRGAGEDLLTMEVGGRIG